MSEQQIEHVVSLINELRSNDTEKSNESAAILSELSKNPDIFPVLHQIYKRSSGDEAMKRGVLICYRSGLLHLFQTDSPQHDVLEFAQDSLMELESFETDQNFLTELSILATLIFSRTKQGWRSIHCFLETGGTNLENYLFLLTHYLTQVIPTPIHLLVLAAPQIERAFQGGFSERINAFCLLATARLVAEEGVMMMERFIPAIQNLYELVFEADTEHRVHVFFAVLSFCIQYSDDKDLIERVCPTIRVIETVMNPGLTYTARIVIREYLNERFLQMSVSEDDATRVLVEMIRLCVWLYGTEIDEATSTINDFVPILRWFAPERGVPLFLQQARILAGQGRPETSCAALDLIRAVLSKNGDLEGITDFICACLALPDFRVKCMATAVLRDFQIVLEDSIASRFERIVDIILEWAQAVVRCDLSVDREEFSIPCVTLLLEMIDANMNLDSVLERILTLASIFITKGTVNEQYYSILLLGKVCESNTPKVGEHIRVIAAMILDQLPHCHDDSLRAVCYITIAPIGFRCKEIVVERLTQICSLIAGEESIEAKVRGIEAIGRLAPFVEEVHPFLGPTATMTIQVLEVVTSEDSVDWKNVCTLLISLGSIANVCQELVPTTAPVILSNLRKVFESRNRSGLLMVPAVLRQVLSVLPQEMTDGDFSVVINEIPAMLTDPKRKQKDDVTTALLEALSDILDEIQIEGVDVKQKLVLYGLHMLKSMAVDYEFTDEKIKLEAACSRLLQLLISSATEPEMMPSIREALQYSIAVVRSDISHGKSVCFVLLAAIVSSMPELANQEEWTSILQIAMTSLDPSARHAKNAAYLIKRLVIAMPAIVASRGTEALERVAQILADETPGDAPRLYLQDTLIGTFSMIAQAVGLPFEQYLNVAERFLPVVTDSNEMDDVYSYLCQNFQTASDACKHRIFCCFVKLSVVRSKIVYLVKDGSLSFATCMGIWNIMKTVLDALEDAKATVAEILGHNEDAIQGFGSFMNTLLIIEQHPSDFSSE